MPGMSHARDPWCYTLGYMTLTKDAIIGFLVLLLALGGLFRYLSTRPTPPPVFETATSTPSRAVPAPGLITDSSKFYEVKAEYPSRTPLFTSVGADADANAVSEMRKWQEDTIADFKTQGNFDAIAPDAYEMHWYDEGRKQALNINFTTVFSSRTVTYIYLVYVDTFGAHPNAYYNTFTFDLVTGAPLATPDLFVSGSGYLRVLSEKSRAILAPHIALVSEIPQSEFDPTYMNDGTEPTEANFQFTYLEGTDVVILFPPYQVGPWALGKQDARIPKSELSAVLKAEYR